MHVCKCTFAYVPVQCYFHYVFWFDHLVLDYQLLCSFSGKTISPAQYSLVAFVCRTEASWAFWLYLQPALVSC